MTTNVNLSTIIKRLEAVTSRLEDISSSQAAAPTSSSRSLDTVAAAGHSNSQSQTHTQASAPPTSASGSGSGSGSGSKEMSPAVQAYQDDIVNGALASLIAKSKEIGGIVEQHTALLGPVCQAQLDFLQLASSHAKPAASGLGPLLKPQADAIGKVMEAKDTLNRSKEGREWGACLSVVGEGVSAWGWVQVEPAPAPFVGEMKNAAQFWSDRVIKQFKETNPAAVAWVKAFSELLDTLQKYVKQYHTTGVAWNPKGDPAPSSVPSSSAAPAQISGAPPPPPPPPSDFQSAPKPSTGGGGPAGAGALLAELNRGGSVTSGLKKVDPSQMTHKNPELRTSSTVPVSDSQKKEPPAVGKKPAALIKKPAKCELEDGNKWMVEYQENNREIIIDQTSLHQTVHIFNCTNSTIRIIGKINAVSMVGCKKTALVMESAVSSLSITSSPSFEVQITGTVPTVQVDTTDSGQVYLSKECMDIVEIITSKTSSINISVPTGDEGDFKENALPEQIKSTFKDGKVVSEIVEHVG